MSVQMSPCLVLQQTRQRSPTARGTGIRYRCPQPPSSAGKQQLPDPQLLAERFLLRHKFEADPRGTNLMFAFFAQHFTHQFFKTSGKMGRGFTKALGHGVRALERAVCGTWGARRGTGVHRAFRSSFDSVLSWQVDLGHLYGDNLQRQHQLRLFRDGKLKFQVPRGTTGLSPVIQGCLKPMSLWQLPGQRLLGASGDASAVGDPRAGAPWGVRQGPRSSCWLEGRASG